jgi:cytoskeletal protein RodZ
MAVSVSLDRRAVQVTWDASLTDSAKVTLRASSEERADVSNTQPLSNDGLGVITFPADFSGSTFIEVLDENGDVVDSGQIAV